MARQGLNRWNQRTGYWRTHGTAPAVAEAAEQDAAAGAARAHERDRAALTRIVHPSITAPSFLCHRVVRLYVSQEGTTEREVIGFGSLRQALAVSTTEEWRAQIIDPNGKVASDNWRRMERR